MSTRWRSAPVRRSASPDGLRRVYRGERKRHERIPDGAHSHRTGDVFALLPREQKVPRRAAERKDAGLRLAVRARPEEEPGRPQLEAAELAELNLEAPLSPAYALWRAVPFDQTHLDLNLYAGVRAPASCPSRRAAPLSRRSPDGLRRYASTQREGLRRAARGRAQRRDALRAEPRPPAADGEPDEA